MLRHLRIVAAWFCLALFMCFVVLWGQSYNEATLLYASAFEDQGIYVGSWRGDIAFCCHKTSGLDYGTDLYIAILAADKYGKLLRVLSRVSSPSETILGFRSVTNNSIVWKIDISHWWLVAICLIAATLFKPSPRHRFSIGELLIGTAVFACFFAAILVLGRFVYVPEPDVDTRIASQQVAEPTVSAGGHYLRRDLAIHGFLLRALPPTGLSGCENRTQNDQQQCTWLRDTCHTKTCCFTGKCWFKVTTVRGCHQIRPTTVIATPSDPC